MTLTRRELIKTGMTFVGVGALGAGLWRCGDESDPGPDPPAGGGDCLADGTSASIAANHGHTLTVARADVTAGLEKTYDIQGTSLHGHSVTLTAADFADLQQNQSITATSTSGGGHTHGITVRCA